MSILDYLTLTLRAILGGVFISYGLNKVLDNEAFSLTISKYGILPRNMSKATARILPLLEVTLGTLLLFGLFPVPILVILAFLLLAFSFALIKLALSKSSDKKNCGCGGNQNSSPIKAILRNSLLLLTIGWILWLYNTNGEPSYNWVTLLLGFVVLTFVGIQLTSRSAGLVEKFQNAKHLGVTGDRQENSSPTNLSTRRGFTRAIGSIGLGLMGLVLSNSLKTASAGNVGRDDVPTCVCNYSTPCGTVQPASLDCSCCRMQCTMGSCTGTRTTFYIYCCRDNPSLECDVIPQTIYVTCLC